MAKKKGWFGWVKRFFTSEAKTRTQKAALTPPERTLREAMEEPKKHAFNVAMATAAAAEVVRLTSQPYHYFTKFDKNLAAIKIQSAYRAHLSCETPATTLKRSPSNRRGQAEIWKRSIPAANEGCNDSEKKRLSSSQRELEEKEATSRFGNLGASAVGSLFSFGMEESVCAFSASRFEAGYARLIMV
ncbi:unnamed protein product [Prunus armeniaca]